MPKPLIVNVAGMRRIGVSLACIRVAQNLNSRGINTMIMQLNSGKSCTEFSDNVVLGKYDDVDVIMFDKHFYTESAARRNLHNALWGLDAAAKPHLSVLMSPNSSDKDRHKTYLHLAAKHFGTDNHKIVSTAGRDGLLYAAGNIKRLILRELEQ